MLNVRTNQVLAHTFSHGTLNEQNLIVRSKLIPEKLLMLMLISSQST